MSVSYKDATGTRFFSETAPGEDGAGPSPIFEVWLALDGTDQELVRRSARSAPCIQLRPSRRRCTAPALRTWVLRAAAVLHALARTVAKMAGAHRAGPAQAQRAWVWGADCVTSECSSRPDSVLRGGSPAVGPAACGCRAGLLSALCCRWPGPARQMRPGRRQRGASACCARPATAQPPRTRCAPPACRPCLAGSRCSGWV